MLGVTEPDPWDPGSPRNRDRTRDSQRQVRAMLMDWDPIGVAGAAEASDEYVCMISPLLHKLFAGDSSEALAAWIDEERREHFGLRADPHSDVALATRLARWWAARTSGA